MRRLFVLLVLLPSCRPTDSRAADSATVPHARRAAVDSGAARFTTWHLDSAVSPMGDPTTYHIGAVASLATAPGGVAPPMLAVQCRRGSAPDVLLASQDGATAGALQTVRVRFDSAPATASDWTVASVARPVLRAPNPAALLRQLGSASTLVVEYPTPVERVTHVFGTQGFVSALARLRAICAWP